MPTGGGKSLCYQLPALLMEGTTIVISPLIALMQDQVNAAKQLGIRAEFVNSTLSYDAHQNVMQQLHSGELDLLYMAPERLQQAETLTAIQEQRFPWLRLMRLTVCLGGDDFRPDYLQLSIFKEIFPATL